MKKILLQIGYLLFISWELIKEYWLISSIVLIALILSFHFFAGLPLPLAVLVAIGIILMLAVVINYAAESRSDDLEP